MQLVAVGIPALQRVEVQGVFEIALDARQLAREERLFASLLELLALPRLQFIEMLIHRLERAELLDECLRSFFADAGHTGNVVDGVAHDGHDFDDLVGRDAERFFHSFRVVEHLAAGVVEADAVADELEEILVRGGDDDVVAAVARSAGERADQVVRFPVFDSDDRNVKAFQHFVDEGELHREVVRHRTAIFLVVRERLMPRLRRSDVEGHGDVIRVVVLEQLLERGGEAVDRVGGQAGGIGQAANGEIGAVDVVGAVDEEEGGAFRHGGGL